MDEQKPVVAVIGNINIDLILRPLVRFPGWGEEAIVPEMEYRCAGAAGYVLKALSAMCIPSYVVAAAGNDELGRKLLEDISTSYVLNAHEIRLFDTPTCISVALVNGVGERAFVTYLGHLNVIDIEYVLTQWERIRSAKHMLLCGYFLLPKLRGQACCKILEKAQRDEMKTLFDTGWDPENWKTGAREEILALLPVVDVFLPNETEAQALTGAKEPHRMLELLLCAGAKTVIVKLGSQGCVGTDGNEIFESRAERIPIVDTTGAGDIFNASIIYGLEKGWPLDQCMNFANTFTGKSISGNKRSFPTFGTFLQC